MRPVGVVESGMLKERPRSVENTAILRFDLSVARYLPGNELSSIIPTLDFAASNSGASSV